MWPFSKELTKASIENHKTIKINGWKFVIRKINPFIDFKDGTMPQIFTAIYSKRGTEKQALHQAVITKIEDQMKTVIEAGLIFPALSPRGTKNEITVDDLFRDSETVGKLYLEIFMHSMNQFRGIRGFFTSLRIKFLLWTLWQKDTAKDPVTLLSEVAN